MSDDPKTNETGVIRQASAAIVFRAPSNLMERLTETKKNAEALRAFVKNVLVEGKDYGTIPGTSKPCLYKAGAETTCLYLGLAPTFHEQKVVEDFAAEPPFFFYRFVCRLTSRETGETIGEGLGSCNSKEAKYRYRTDYWRDREEDPPTDQGWKKWKGKYGWTWRKRTENADTADVANTILKMAKKRAFVDAVLTAAGLSEFFEQDLDDINWDLLRDHDDQSAPASAAKAAQVSEEDVEKVVGWFRDAAIEGKREVLDAAIEMVKKYPKAVREDPRVRKVFGEAREAIGGGS